MDCLINEGRALKRIRKLNWQKVAFSWWLFIYSGLEICNTLRTNSQEKKTQKHLRFKVSRSFWLEYINIIPQKPEEMKSQIKFKNNKRVCNYITA